MLTSLSLGRGPKTSLSKFLSWSLVSLVAGVSGGWAVQASAGNDTQLPAANFVGIRPAAMGQAFTAVADDQNALYYNPAGLAKLEGWSLEILSPIFGWNQNLKDNGTAISEKFQNSGGGGNGTTAILETMRLLSGDNHSVRMGWNPYFVMRNFGAAIMTNAEANLTARNPGESFLNFDGTADMDFRMGGGFRFFGDKLAVGGALAWRERATVNERLDWDQLTDMKNAFDDSKADTAEGKQAVEDLKSLVRTGCGVGLDTGILFTPVPTWTPTIGVSILNVGDTTFKQHSFCQMGNISKKAPEPLPQSVNLGVSLTPVWDTVAGEMFVRGAMDFRDINLPTPASQKLSLGVEGGWRKLASVQMGLSEGHLTAGFELRLYIFNLRYATYATERGFFPRQSADRRHVVGVKLLF